MPVWPCLASSIARKHPATINCSSNICFLELRKTSQLVLDLTSSRLPFLKNHPSVEKLAGAAASKVLAPRERGGEREREGGRERMAVGRGLLLLLAAVLVGFASASPFQSDSLFQASTESMRRSLLQAKNNCPVNFEFQNYTIITSKCKGPKYPAKQCCDAFKEFACPYNTYINDVSNDCASTMFSYINLYGKYPPGLFASMCREGKLGLSCEGVVQKDAGVAGGGQQAQSSLLALITLLCGLATLLFR